MASKYAKATMPTNGAEIYNAIITDTPSLQSAGLPFAATETYVNGEKDSRVIGQFLYNNVDLSNMFLNSMLNTVALTLVQSKVWTDPWMGLEKGKLDYGDVIQEVFINMSAPHSFDPALAEKEVFKREIPDVLTAFHTLNYQKWYKQTISNEELRQAFRSWQGLVDFIAKIISKMFTTMNYDVNQVKRYMIARALLNGAIYMESITAITDKSTAENAVALARTTSMNMLEMSPTYNFYQVPNFANYEDQVIILNNTIAGKIDVSVLAVDFNMDKAEFLAMHRLSVSSFGNLDNTRLTELFANDPTFKPISAAELTTLNSVAFVIFDRSWFQIYDYIQVVTNIYNSDGLYWNYDLHCWKYFGVSPFANACGFVAGTIGVTSVAVSPTAATVTAGQKVQLSATVVTTGFAPQTVVWSSSNDNVTVNSNGVVTVPSTIASGTTITITATSTKDSTKSATSTITVA